MKVSVMLSKDGSNGHLAVNNRVFKVTNKVRRLSNGTRGSSEVIRSIPDNRPYDPHLFPAGTWRITGIEWQKEKDFDPRTFGPVKIRTDAWQMVNVWKLDRDGDYIRETAEQTKDTGYLLHYSAFTTTWGCIRLASQEDAVELGSMFSNTLRKGEKIILEVNFE